jgi:hypothetical protein
MYKVYKLLDWIDINMLDLEFLCKNKSDYLIPYLEQNMSMIDWKGISSNENAISLLKQNKDKIVWQELLENHSDEAVNLLEEKLDYFKNNFINQTINVLSFMHEKQFNWENFFEITHPNKIYLLEKVIKKKFNCSQDEICEDINIHDSMNLDFINWSILSGNPNAIGLLENNIDKIDWSVLSGNTNAISLLENNIDLIDWEQLSGNKNAIHILESYVK